MASFFQVFHGLRGDFSDRAASTESYPHQAVFALELVVWGKPWHFGNGAKIKCHEKWGGLQILNSLLETNLHPPADMQFVDCSSECMEKTHRWMTKGQKGDSGAEHGSIIRSNTCYTRVVNFLCGLAPNETPLLHPLHMVIKGQTSYFIKCNWRNPLPIKLQTSSLPTFYHVLWAPHSSSIQMKCEATTNAG